MEWTANDRIAQFYHYTNLSKRNLELARLKTSYEKKLFTEHFAHVVKGLADINETLKRKLTINESNIRNVIQQDAFLQIPTDDMRKIVSNLDDVLFAKRKKLDLLQLKVKSSRERYQNLLTKIFLSRMQVETHDPRATEEQCKMRLLASNLTRCQASIRIARNVQAYYERIKCFLQKDNLDNERSLAALKQSIDEQMMLIRKTTVIGRSVIGNVAKLNNDLKRSTRHFNNYSEFTQKSLQLNKKVLSKERVAIVDASMKDIDPKRWPSRYDAMTRSMEDLQAEKEKLHSTILDMKHAALSTCETKILSEMENKTKRMMQLEQDIYAKEAIFKKLDEKIDNLKYFPPEEISLPPSTENIGQRLKEEREKQAKLKASLARLNSMHMMLDQFFTYIPQIIERSGVTTIDLDVTNPEYEKQQTLLALLRLFKAEG